MARAARPEKTTGRRQDCAGPVPAEKRVERSGEGWKGRTKGKEKNEESEV